MDWRQSLVQGSEHVGFEPSRMLLDVHNYLSQMHGTELGHAQLVIPVRTRAESSTNELKSTGKTSRERLPGL
jgi:hypothetical protein